MKDKLTVFSLSNEWNDNSKLLYVLNVAYFCYYYYYQ